MVLKLPEHGNSFGKSFDLVREQVAVASFSERARSIFSAAKKRGLCFTSAASGAETSTLLALHLKVVMGGASVKILTFWFLFNL